MSHVTQIRQQLAPLDALLLTDPISIRYASGFYITDGAALLTPGKAWLITDSRYVEAAAQAVPDMEVLSVSAQKPLYTLLRELADSVGCQTVGAEETRLSHSAWETVSQRLGRSLTPASSILARLRASKDAGELSQMIAAQRIAEKALDEVLGIIRPGLTEKQVAAELVYRMYKYGGEANSFDPIVITGKKTSMPHGVPGDEIIRDGDFVTMDFGTVYGGYCSDMTRTVAVGHASQEMRQVYATVLEAQLAGIAAARPGMTGRDIDKAARDVIGRAGYGQYFGHSFGHSLGLEIHEAPNASPSNGEPMPEGAVISAEPGIYIPGRFGVRIEDVLWLHDGGAENITQAPKSLIIL
jgi:Xaa-Pro aminopeptidase